MKEAYLYGEELPDQCPPEDALDDPLPEVYRLVATASPVANDFASKASLGLEKPVSTKATDCEWASCSLSLSADELLKIKGLRRRLRYVAKLSIPAGAGKHRTKGKSLHVDFWRYSSFELATAVQTVKEHGLT
jgi:hypothetical protein